MKALVVLDDQSLQREIADFFGRRLSAEMCDNRSSALAAVSSQHFPFAVLDLAVDGALEVCRAIRARQDGDQSYVMAALLDEKPAALREALEAGVDDYLTRPLRIASLQLRMAIAERHLARRLRQQRTDTGLGERRYRTLVQSMNEGVFLVDGAGRIEFANTRMSSLTGFKIDELVGQSADDLLVDQGTRERLPGGSLLGSGIGSEEYTLPIQRKDGGQVWVQLVGAPTLTQDGQDGSMGIVQDLTAQRRAEEGLRHREEYFRALLDSSSDLISIIGLDGQILYQSPSSEVMLGLPPELMTGQEVHDFLHPDDLSAFERALETALTGGQGQPPSVEVRLRRSGGEWLYVDAHCVNMVENPVIGGVVVTSRDVTERRRAEAALKRERAFFQQLFDKSPAGIVVLDTKDRVVDANRSFVDLFQFEIEELAGRQLVESIVPDDRHQEATELAQTVAGGQNVVHETLRQRKDGTAVDVSIVCYPVDVAGRRVGAFGIYTDITERKQAERQLFHEAFHDALTGLPNRSLLSERLERCVKRSRRRADYRFALLFIDLDRFKSINDTLGHAAGDELLVEMARRLELCTRPGDTVARLGGDEFTLILDDLGELADATAVARRILESLSSPFKVAGQEVTSSGSIGIAFSSPSYHHAEDLMRDADIAMYRAKSAGKARYEIFDQVAQKDATERSEAEESLRAALGADRFELHYQPIHSLVQRKIVGFEALARLRHPEHGLQLPATWLPALRESALELPFGRWVLETACLQLASWLAVFPEQDAAAVSINLSLSELAAEDFLDEIDAATRAGGVPPAAMTFELPDTVLDRPEKALVDRLWALRRRGFRLAIQDFGIAPSSLQQLHKLPIDCLKIDRTLLAGIERGGESAQLTQAVAAVGESMGLRVVAVGVESDEQLEKLRQLGVPYAQGHLFSPPVPAQETEGLIRRPADQTRPAETGPARS